jgi:DNA-binding LacI/PurR family transcriptional regulator
LPTIDIDHQAAAREMTEYLIGLGHQRIGFVGGQHDISTARQREAGFRAGMTAAGLTCELIVGSDFTYSGGFDATRRLLAEHAPTAVFAANDQMALGALNAARAAGRHVPTDVTVVGFGDTGAAEHAAPALTTVSMPRHQLGMAAMEALLGAIETKSSRIDARRLPYRIVLRESSAPPRAETRALEERTA